MSTTQTQPIRESKDGVVIVVAMAMAEIEVGGGAFVENGLFTELQF